MAASTVLRKSFSETGSSPCASRCAFITVRRYFVTVTPGTDTGYWNAMKRPIRERSSESASVMSWPLKRIEPSVTSSEGCPMIAFASVDLPEPFGPISAWISPLPTDRSTPFRISLSSALTCRSRISISDIGLRLSESGKCSTGLDDGQRGGAGPRRGNRHRVGTARELDELRERCALERLDDAALHPHPQQLRGAGLGPVALVRARHAPGGDAREAVHRSYRALQCEHH